MGQNRVGVHAALVASCHWIGMMGARTLRAELREGEARTATVARLPGPPSSVRWLGSGPWGATAGTLRGGSGVQPSPAAWASAGKYPFPPPDRCNSAIPRGANDGAGKLSEVRPHGLVGRPPRTRERFPRRRDVSQPGSVTRPVPGAAGRRDRREPTRRLPFSGSRRSAGDRVRRRAPRRAPTRPGGAPGARPRREALAAAG